MLMIVLLILFVFVFTILLRRFLQNKKRIEELRNDLGMVSYDYETSQIRQKVISYHLLDKYGPLVSHLYEMNSKDKGW